MKNNIIILGAGVVIALLIFGGCTSTQQNGNNNQNNNSNQPPTQNDTEIRINQSDISTNARFYSYDDNGVTIRYFAVRDKQGTVHVAFDACDVCYEAKKGYKQNGDVMQCFNCGTTFAITGIGTENKVGGCWPSYLPMTISGNDVVIKIADLKAKSYMF